MTRFRLCALVTSCALLAAGARTALADDASVFLISKGATANLKSMCETSCGKVGFQGRIEADAHIDTYRCGLSIPSGHGLVGGSVSTQSHSNLKTEYLRTSELKTRFDEATEQYNAMFADPKPVDIIPVDASVSAGAGKPGESKPMVARLRVDVYWAMKEMETKQEEYNVAKWKLHASRVQKCRQFFPASGLKSMSALSLSDGEGGVLNRCECRAPDSMN